MAATTGMQIRISEATNTSIKALAKKAPQFSASSLADQLLSEACNAALGKSSSQLPTVAYLRAKLEVKEPEQNELINTLLDKITQLERTLNARNYLAPESSRLNEEPPHRPAETPLPKKGRAAA